MRFGRIGILSDEKCCILQIGFWNCQTSANKRLTNLTKEKAPKQNLKRVSLQRLKEAAMSRQLKYELKAELQKRRGLFFIVYLLHWGCGASSAYVLIFVHTKIDQFNYSKCSHVAFPTLSDDSCLSKDVSPHHSARSTIGVGHCKASEDFFFKGSPFLKSQSTCCSPRYCKKPCSPIWTVTTLLRLLM